MMRKVGILSMQRIPNYGSFLQAYGLKKIIEDLGNEVVFVDYTYEAPIVDNKLTMRKLSKKIVDNLNVVKKVKIRKGWKHFKNEYKMFIKKYFNIGDEKNIHPQDISNLVIGSDEVFNCMQGYPVGYSKELFGANYDNINVITYAASFGYTNLEMLEKYGISDEVARYLRNLNAISVRDKNSFNIVNQLIGDSPYQNFDPVLVSEFEYSKKVDLKDYIIVYTYPGRLKKNEEKYIKEFAKKNNKKIVSLGFYQTIADLNLYVDPLDVFSYFKNADFIITDTFHGTIFSIKTNSKFCTIIRDSNKNKMSDLLKKLKQEDRKVELLKDIDIMYNQEIDYAETNELIRNERKRTIEYLKEKIK